MARTRGKQQRDFGIVAAAQRINLADRAAAHRAAAVAQPWQAEAWEAYNEVPEIGESLTYRGDLMAQLILFPAVADPENPDGDPIPLADEKVACPPAVLEAATAELARLRTWAGGQAEILRLYEINMQVAGELYLVGYAPDGDEPEEYWAVASTQEVKEQDGEYTVLAKPGDTEGRKLTANDYIERYWTRHPQWAALPDSPLRRLRTDTRAAITLNEQVITEALSTLPAGMLLIPNEIQFEWPAGYTPSDKDAERNPFDVMLEMAIQDGMVPGSFASQYPLTVHGAAEFLKEIRRVSLAREADTTTEARLAARVDRIARGLPLPVEKVMGHQQTTFANAKQVDQDTFDDYLRPSAVSMVTAITYCFYQPHLIENPAIPEDWQKRIVAWFNPSALIADPDPEESADFGVTEGLVKAASWRAKRGWTEEDAPDAEELLLRMAYRRGAIDPGLTAQLLRDLAAEVGVELSVAETQTIAEQSPQQAAALLLKWHQAKARGEPPPHLTPRQPLALTAGATTAPRVIDGGRELLAIDQELRVRWRAAMDAALDRELERTANKLRNTARKLGVLSALQARPEDVAPLLGRAVVAAAGVEYDWSRLRLSFMGLGRRAQDQAVDAAGRIAGGFSTAQRQTLKLRQADDLGTAWKWVQQAMTGLADLRLYDPSTGQYTGVGESDPTSFIPAGMVRQAMNVAGGSPVRVLTDETLRNGEAWISVGDRVEGIGVGERIRDALASEGVEVVRYRWIYGPAIRMHPFEPHQRLDGLVFESFEDDRLANTYGWPVRSHFLPGDHGGCVCDVEPILGAPPPVEEPPPPPPVLGKETGKAVRGFDTPLEEKLARRFAGWRRLRSVDQEQLDELNVAYNAIRRHPNFSVASPTVETVAKTFRGQFKTLQLTKTRAKTLLTTTPENLNPTQLDGILGDATRLGLDPQDIADQGLVVVAKVGDREVVAFGSEHLWAALERGAAEEFYPKVLYWNAKIDVPPGADLERLFHADDLTRVRQAAAREAKATRLALGLDEPTGKATPGAKTSGLAALPPADRPAAAAEQFAKRWGRGGVGGTNVDTKGAFTGMSTRVANDVTDELDRMMRAHPVTAGKLRSVHTVKLGSNTHAQANQATRELTFNSQFYGYGKEKRFQETWEAWNHQPGSGWSAYVEGAAERKITHARYTTTHEFGHHIDYTARDKLGEDAWDQLVQDTIEADWRRVRGTKGKLRRTQERSRGRAKLPPEMAAHVKEHLSTYATTNLREVMAEVVAEATLSLNPRPLATALYKLLLKHAEGIA